MRAGPVFLNLLQVGIPVMKLDTLPLLLQPVTTTTILEPDGSARPTANFNRYISSLASTYRVPLSVSASSFGYRRLLTATISAIYYSPSWTYFVLS
jgi:hypothetical protein